MDSCSFRALWRPVRVYGPCVLSGIRDPAALPGVRFGRGGLLNAFSTSSSSRCEKDTALPPKQNEDGAPRKGSDQAETRTVGERVDGETNAAQTPEQGDEPLTPETDKGTSTHKKDAKMGQGIENAKKVKSGKEGLLDLLGAMKVQVTNKKSFKGVKGQKSFEPTTHYRPADMESTISMFQKAKAEASVRRETLNPELVSAASAAASTLPNPRLAESELLRQLRKHEAVAENQRKGETNIIGTIIADMKVGKRANRQNAWPANQIQFDEDGRGYVHDRGITAELEGVRRRRNLFSGKRLGVFSPATDEQPADSTTAGPTLWDVDFANQLVLSTNQMPRNGFEEMIQWTREEKLWQYPINNEAGLEEEAAVPFHEHVFLEEHLQDGFPARGPVRHFMDLVVAGLAKNPHLTVAQKKEHIAWFRDYFREKEDVLKEAEVYHN